jgi:hypothetical protein
MKAILIDKQQWYAFLQPLLFSLWVPANFSGNSDNKITQLNNV